MPALLRTKMFYREHAKLHTDIIAHAYFLAPMEAKAVDLLTYPLPSRKHRKYEAVVVSTTKIGSISRLAQATHKRGEMEAMNALLTTLQAMSAEKLRQEFGPDDSAVTVTTDGVREDLVHGARSSMMKGLRFLKIGTKVLGHVKSLRREQEPEHNSTTDSNSSSQISSENDTLLAGSGEEAIWPDEPPSSLLEEERPRDVDYNPAPLNTLSDGIARTGSGRLDGNAWYQAFLRRTAALEEIGNDDATHDALHPVARQTYTTPLPTIAERGTTNANNSNIPAPNRYVYPPYIPSTSAQHRQCAAPSPRSTAPAQNGASYIDNADSLPLAYTGPQPSGVTLERRGNQAQARGHGTLTNMESMQERRGGGMGRRSHQGLSE